jgi:F-type H+-transporting ATPase subunit b
MIESILKLPESFNDATTWVLISVILFLLLMIVLGLPRKAAEALDGRRDKIKNELDDAVRMLEEARELLASYQRRAREAETEAEGIIDAAKREAERLTERARVELAQSIERRTEMAERKIAQAEADAAKMVRAHAAEIAAAATTKLLTDKIDAGKADALLDQSVKEFEERFEA